MKLIYVTNIPTPYRIARFNLLEEELRRSGSSLEVLFMAEIEPDRNWKIDYSAMKFNFKIYKGWHPRVGGMFAHLNPGLLIRLLRSDYDAVVIGGMASPTHILTPYFVRLGAVKIMSVESNLDSTRFKSGVRAFVKRKLLDACDAYQVTGLRQREMIEFFSPLAATKSFVRLPNLINEEIFAPPSDVARKTSRAALGDLVRGDGDQLWVLPARLSEEKGILQFLDALRGKSGFTLLILGVGPLEGRIREMIERYAIPARLVGFVQEREVAAYYAAADVFILPSLRDPSPLSPIEAIRMGLPLLISRRLGNADDVCDEENGLLFDPEEPSEIRVAVEETLARSEEQQRSMRSASLARYEAVFGARKNVSRYAEELRLLMAKNQ